VAVRNQVAKEDGRRVPILVKMGDLGDPRATVKFLSKLGVDGVVALNTQKDYDAFQLPAADRSLLEYYTQRFGGGLSGPPILDRSLAQVASARAAVKEFRLGGKFTVIHVGGLQNLEDMQRSRATGAELRQWYTGLMHGLAQPEPLSLYSRFTTADTAVQSEVLSVHA
jgi:dihydroorotate dehydrogenase